MLVLVLGGGVLLTPAVPARSSFAPSTTGVLHLAERLPSLAGIDEALWVAVALAFIDFLDDQDVRRTAPLGTTPRLDCDTDRARLCRPTSPLPRATDLLLQSHSLRLATPVRLRSLA